MFKNLSDETRYGLLFVAGLTGLLVVMLVLNYTLGGNEKPDAEKVKEKTVIVTEAKKDAPPPKPLPKSVVSTVRDALKQGNYSTAYMEINNVSKSSPEYAELRKQLDEATRQRKAPGVRKDAGASQSAPVRYFDESTPRNRTSDAVFVYFVDLSGILVPRFCIQSPAKRPLGITRFTITADGKKFEIMVPAVKVENTEKGVAEVYDVPLDRKGYEAALALIKAKTATLDISGSNGKSNREITDNEKKGFRRVLEGFVALGGNLNYLQESKGTPAASQKKHAK
ncbi:MAG: hypothetical protein WC007_09550 [Pelobacteraceae bacterium]